MTARRTSIYYEQWLDNALFKIQADTGLDRAKLFHRLLKVVPEVMAAMEQIANPAKVLPKEGCDAYTARMEQESK